MVLENGGGGVAGARLDYMMSTSENTEIDNYTHEKLSDRSEIPTDREQMPST